MPHKFFGPSVVSAYWMSFWTYFQISEVCYIRGNYRRPNFQCTLKVRNLEKKWRRGGGLHVHHVEQKRINKLICATLLWWCRVPTNDELCHSEPVELGVQGGICTPNICQIQSPYFIRRGQILPFYRVFWADLILFEDLGGQLKTTFRSKWKYLCIPEVWAFEFHQPFFKKVT